MFEVHWHMTISILSTHLTASKESVGPELGLTGGEGGKRQSMSRK